MLSKLEEIKQLGAYSVSLNFGEDVGCDDSDVPIFDRRVILIYWPVGCLGETKVMFKGTVKEFLVFNFKTKPKQISNPPKDNEYKDGGYFIWGTEDSVKRILEKPFFGKWIEVNET